MTTSSQKKKSPSTLGADLGGLFCFFLGLFTFLALFSFSESDPSFFTATSAKAKNLAGTMGSHWSSLLLQLFGAAAFMLGFIFLLAGTALFRRITKKEWALASANFILLLLTTAAFFALFKQPLQIGGARIALGGLTGDLLGHFLETYLNKAGAALLTSFFLLFAISLALKISVQNMFLYFWLGASKCAVFFGGLIIYASLQTWEALGQAYAQAIPHVRAYLKSAAEQIGDLFRAKDRDEPENEGEKATAPARTEPEIAIRAPLAPVIPLRPAAKSATETEPEAETGSWAAAETQTESASTTGDASGPDIVMNSEGTETETQSIFHSPGEMELSAGEKSKSSPLMNFMKKAIRDNEKSVKAALGKKIKYEMPPLSFLNTPINEEAKLDRDELLRNSKLLEEKLADFNVNGVVTSVKPGPVVTMYEFKPAAGVKVNAISNLADDLALALSAISIRIVAPIPGRDVVGIEVPNAKRESVLLKEIIGVDTFQNRGHSIPIAIGKDILGAPVVADLKKMPHLLVAGTTGSGKSVFINSLICSLLYKFTPRDLQLILVDPKQLELAPYNDIPHLLLPVVTEPKKASLALNWAVQEMERRYRVIAASVTRDQESYNKKLDEIGIEKMEALINKGKEDIDRSAAERMPKLVVVIDELADLMMTAKADVENNICRLAQKARAAGIHLVLATQRPSADVVTGLIKANLPSRICFKVSSKIDSRVMFDAMGAEKLIGMGDMLFMPPGESRLVRMHGAYISVEEVDQITSFWRAQEKPTYRDDILVDPEEDMEGGAFSSEDANDPLYQQALEIAFTSGAISASYLQRRLRIGYNKAARFVEMMESQGVVGPAEGSKPRPVLQPRL